MSNLVVPINNLGEYGVVQDVPPQELPMNVWSAVANFRFRNGYAEKIDGHQAAFGTPTVAPYYLMPVQGSVSYYWLYASLLKAYVFDGATHTDVTRLSGDYHANANDNWTSAILGGIPILNNVGDKPQMWLPVSLAQPLQDLTNWPATALCKAMRSFKVYLVALDVIKAGTRYPQMVKWSHPAAAGTVPSSWDETDPTKDAGEYSLSETPDFVLDCAPLRDINIVYKENTTWGMQYIGGIDIFRFYSIFNSAGALSRRCAQEFFSGVHAVLGDDDIYKHDGQNATSLLTRKMKRSFFSRIDATNYVRSFSVVNFAQREVWFCIPESGNSFCTLALVWNWEENTIGLRDIPLAAHIIAGVSNVGTGADSWSSDGAAWSSDISSWDERLYNPATRGLFMAVPGIPQVYQADQTTQFAGVSYNAYIERTGLGIPLRANQPPDISQNKYLTRLYPRIEGTPGGIVKISVGGQMRVGDTPSYSGPKNFIIGTDKFLDFRVPGKLFAIKYLVDSAIDMKISGHELELRAAGRN